MVHALLRLDTREELLGHPIVGASWEGHVVETLIRAAPQRSASHFYRTAAGAELDLVLDLPGNRRWAIEVKHGQSPTLTKGFHHAVEDTEPDRSFLVYSGDERYPKSSGVEVIGLRELAGELAGS